MRRIAVTVSLFILVIIAPLLVLALNTENSGFEDNSFEAWSTSQEGSGGTYSKRVIPTPVFEGQYAAEFTLKVTNKNFDVLRNEITKRNVATIGGNYVYQFAQYVPSDFATSPLFIETAQFLPDKQHLGRFKGWGPPVAIGIKAGYWQLKISRNRDGRVVRTAYDLGPVKWNRWTHFTVEVLWSAKNNGLVKVYRDGIQVFRRAGASTFSSTEIPSFKCGMYTRRIWTLSGPAPLQRFRIVHDGFSVTQID